VRSAAVFAQEGGDLSTNVRPVALVGVDEFLPRFRIAGANLLDQPEHEVAVHRHMMILRAGKDRQLQRSQLQRPLLPATADPERRVRLADTLRLGGQSDGRLTLLSANGEPIVDLQAE